MDTCAATQSFTPNASVPWNGATGCLEVTKAKVNRPCRLAETRPGSMTTPTLTETEMRGFVGPNADYYLTRWKPMLEGQDWSGFNWAACLISGFWLPYRKMYGAATVVYGIAFLGTLIEELADAPNESSGLRPLVRLIVAVVCGAFGN